MLALLAIIAGSVITGYSAYRIHAIRRGRGRKLRDMEVLRRLDVPPKKQVRIWSFLMILGLVLLTPGLGYLLSLDPISGSGVDATYSDLVASSPSGSPVVVPPSEKLDKKPRIVDEDEFGSSSRTFFASSGGGSSKRSSSGGGGTTSRSTSSENVTGVNESSGGEYSITYVSKINDSTEISEKESASSGPEIDTASEATTTKSAESEDRNDETGPKQTETLTESAKIDKAPEKISAQGASEPSEVGETEPTLAEASTESIIVEADPEKEKAIVSSGYSVAETVLKSTPSETLNEPAIIGARPEDSIFSEASEPSRNETMSEADSVETSTEGVIIDSAQETLIFSEASEPSKDETMPEADPAETSTEGVIVDSAQEPLIFSEASEPSRNETMAGADPAETSTKDVTIDTEPEKSRATESAASSEMEGEYEPPSSKISPKPSDFEGESDLAETTPSFAASDQGEEADLSRLIPTIEDPAENNNSDQSAKPSMKTGPRIGGVKKLEFKEGLASLTNGIGNDSGDGTEAENELLPNLDGPFGDFETGPRLDTFGQGFDFEMFQNFNSTTGIGKRADKNVTSSPVTIMEFEKIDLGSDFHAGFGLTPTSPFG
jgi:hypothetical protein